MASRFRFVAAVVAAALGAVLTFVASAQSQYSAQERAGIEGIVKDYLVRNPEILREALTELVRREKATQTKAVIDVGDTLTSAQQGIVVGNPHGDVTLVEFFDYNCVYCKKAVADIEALVKEDPDVRVVLRDLPILGPDSVEASRIALALRRQFHGQKLYEYHQRLLATKGQVGREQATLLAKQMGADLAQLQRDLNAPELGASIDFNEQIAQKLGVVGTPAFVVGDAVMGGIQDPQALRQSIKTARLQVAR